MFSRPGLILLFLVAANNALAQADTTVTLQQLQKELAERDQAIISLLNRVRDLEQKLSSNGGSSAQMPAGKEMAAKPMTVSNRTVSAATEAQHQSSGPGFDIDALAAERALERSLVQQGVRLLGAGQMEVIPSASYARYESDFATVLSGPGGNFVGNVDQIADVSDLNIGFRAGLPFRSQLQINLPYRMVHRQSTASIDGVTESASSRTASATGDVVIGLASQLATQHGWRPNLVSRVDWLTGTGDEQSDGVVLGGGYEGVSAHLNASWRRDPIVFLLGGGYTHYSDNDGFNPGDSVDFSLGTALAVSPETALIFSLDQSYSQEFELNGQPLDGTDRLSSVFNIATSTILGRGLLLRFDAGIGLTNDAPDYRFRISLPFRFDLY